MHTKDRFLTRLETEAIIDKLGGVDGALNFIKMGPQIKDPTWKQVRVGTLGSAEDARRKLSERGVGIGKEANQILDKVKFEGFEKTIRLVLIEVKNLNLGKKATTERVMVRARANGLHPCPPEAALQLSLQYPGALAGTEGWPILVGMVPLSPPGVRNKLVFRVCGNSLNTDTGHPEATWHDKHQWVFVVPPQ